MDRGTKLPDGNGLEIAIIGMSCRFPGGNNIDSFWERLQNGTCSVSLYTDEELREAGVNQEDLQNPHYVKAGGAITHTEWFDTHLFHYSPREAEVMDPQLKVLHECAWEALENSGYCSDRHNGLVGTYIGSSTNLYWMDTVYREASDFLKEAELLNGSQFFSTRLSHQLNLKGPSYTVQTACSSSLVAVHLACQALLSGDCDLALAGGVSITLPEKRGYLYQEGMILSPDGICRPFDSNAKGTVNGNGAGIVVLKRLEDALADGDFIYAIVKGSAINNDGSYKVSFTAPSVEGQASAIKAAHMMAEVEPESITYVEAHGTGTILGDPIEIEGLKLAFNTEKRKFCGIGSVKANIGHLDNAAGVAGLIKTALSLQNCMIPPTINYETPNEKIDFENSPFYVNTELREWKNSEFPLRAGVSSFGIGGTNAHVVLEESIDRGVSDPGKKNQLLFFSAQTMKSLDEMTRKLVNYMDQNSHVNLADIAYTLHVGRKHLRYQRMLVASELEEAKRELSQLNPAKVHTAMSEQTSRPVIFMFPGQGSQYMNMGLDLYREEKVFRDEVDRCCQILEKIRGTDLRHVWYPQDQKVELMDEINQTSNAQPAIFIFEYALAKMFMEWGIHPDGMIGHSIGEYVAACLSGVLSLEHALTLVSERADLMQQLPKGCMLSVMAPESRIFPYLTANLSIAAVNGPSFCVVSGSFEEIESLEEVLHREGLRYKRLQTSHAFHSTMMEPILDSFGEKVQEIELHKPLIPYISNVSGTWITAIEATDPQYWVKHLRQTVKFSDGINQLLTDAPANIFIEMGPGRALSTLVRQQIREESDHVIVNTVRSHVANISDDKYLLQSLGKLQIQGVGVDWQEYYAQERRFRLPLPTYSFDRQLFSIRSDDENRTIQIATDEFIVEDQGTQYHASMEVNHDVAPQLDKEQKLIEAYEKVTGVRDVNPYDDFFELGGNSLSAVNVVARLQEEFHISVSQLFEYPRVADLAQQITDKKDKNKVPKEMLKNYLVAMRERHQISENGGQEFAETRQSYEVRTQTYHSLDLSRRLNYTDILLTGSTGYLGVYLLRDLLQKTDSNLHLIIRARSRTEAENRIKGQLSFYFGPAFYDQCKSRMFVYNGDLTKIQMGLDVNVYQKLCKTIQCVVHSAADVSHYGKYAEIHEANSVATNNLIDFSLSGNRKDFNHISTMAVASGKVEDQKELLYTEYDHDLGQVITNPYPKTKLEAEKLLVEARKKGVHVNIFRVGNVVFDSQTGRFQKNIEQNALYSMIQSYVKIGLVPEIERDTDFSCVDDVSRSIVCLFDQAELVNETYHIFNPNYVSLSELLTIPNLELGVKQTSIEDFLDYIYDEKQAKRFSTEIYNIQLHSLGDELNLDVDHPTIFHVTSDKTTMLLKKMGFGWKEMNEQQARKMIEYCQSVNFF
ncbi:type I polyketide synthase [Hazenella coriacea]|uniref:Thioester reductase-like protein n=1 Tax=Hazenella coriacea TaxID=1179467 RepID=A0A4R3LF62_9BACL|nr:type I polyketide synthase [Hazenella coriacea]TCS97014.1 thioester reductase-like protein [Hazenella coriacea]